MTNSNPQSDPVSNGDQQSIDSESLRLVAAQFFTESLRMLVQPDWGVLVNGACQCLVGVDCSHPGKHPSVSNPRGHATGNINTIAGWIRAGRNLAVVPERYIVIDIEIKAAHDGLTPFVTWCDLAGLDVRWMLSTFTVRSGGGGLHLYFWLPRDVVPPKGMDGWLPDVDIKTSAKRSDKATIPGSRHGSGRLYEFELNEGNSTGFNMPLRAPQVLLDEVAAGHAWELRPQTERPPWEKSSTEGGAVNFSDFIDASALWHRARILGPGAPRPPKSDFAGMALGSLSDAHMAWVRSTS